MDGAIYDPQADAWSLLPAAPIGGTGAAWTGRDLLVWGSAQPGVVVARYDLGLRSWEEFRSPLRAGWELTGAWVGNELVLVSYVVGESMPDAVAFNPRTERWRRIAESPLDARHGPPAIVAGHEVLFLTGFAGDAGLVANAAYNPETDRWRSLSAAGFSGYVYEQPQWTGRHVVYYGRTIAVYDVVEDTWQPVPQRAETSGREQAAIVWSGSELLVWGGSGTGDGDPPTKGGLGLRLDIPTEVAP